MNFFDILVIAAFEGTGLFMLSAGWTGWRRGYHYTGLVFGGIGVLIMTTAVLAAWGA